MDASPVTPLRVTYKANDEFDVGLLSVCKRGSNSRCFFGNKAKVAAALSDDPNWSRSWPKFMPEKGEARFSYGDLRFAQELSAADIAWIDNFDTGQPVRSRTIVLDPNGPNTRCLGERRHRQKVPTGRKTGGEGDGACNSNSAVNSGRAKRMRALVQARVASQAAA